MNRPEKPLTPARIAEILEALSLDGQHYANNTYDKKRYARIEEMARTLRALPTDVPPLSRITPVTPKVGVDGAVFRDSDILLIRRGDTRQWALPGGAVELGEAPSEAVRREVVEETGIVMSVDNLVGVFDNWMDRRVTAHHLYHVVVRGQFAGGTLNPQPEEVLEVVWCKPGELPRPEEFHPGHYERILKALQGTVGYVD